jgi:hypothetical protein
MLFTSAGVSRAVDSAPEAVLEAALSDFTEEAAFGSSEADCDTPACDDD